MSLFKYIDRIKSIHHLIEKAGTGTSDEFAIRIGISRSLLMEHLRELRETFDAPIVYCRRRQTFYYKKPFRLSVSISSEMETIKGGIKISGFMVESNRTGLTPSTFDLRAFMLATDSFAADSEKRMSRREF
jgi:hypothetical protein